MKVLLALLLTTLGVFSKPVLAPTNYPLAYFTERMAGDFAEILYEIPADVDPAFWKPTDAQISAIQKADLIIINGATYEKWSVTTSLPDDKIVDTSLAFADSLIEIESSITHSHGNEGEHSHGGTAFTTWLDLKQASQQATAIKEALTATFPDHADSINKAYLKLTKDLIDLHEEMEKAAAALATKTFLASHPIYQYFSRAYGLKIHTLLWEPEMELTPNALAKLKKLQQKHPAAKTFIWEGNPTDGHIPTLEKLGLKSIIITPSFSKPGADTDFLQAMRNNLEALKSAGE
jgi:zinc transport system substrate-binding protein